MVTMLTCYRCSFVTGAHFLEVLIFTGAHLLQERAVTGAHTILIGNAKDTSNDLSTSKWCFVALWLLHNTVLGVQWPLAPAKREGFLIKPSVLWV